MERDEIDIRAVKAAVNAVLDHLLEDIGLERVAIEPGEDFYWLCSDSQPDGTSQPRRPAESGRLSDDAGFVSLVRRGEGADVSYNLVHIAPLLHYIGEKVKR